MSHIYAIISIAIFRDDPDLVIQSQSTQQRTSNTDEINK